MRTPYSSGLIILLLGAALLVSCAPKQFRTGANIDRTYDFSQAKTYAFVVTREKVAGSAGGRRLQQAIREELTARGYQEVPADSAAVHISYDLGIYAAAKLYREADQPDGEGGMSIWVKDRKTGNTVWYGWAERVVKPGQDPDIVIRSAVRSLFEDRIPDAPK